MNSLLLLIGRVALGLIFLMSGLNKVSNFGPVVEKMQAAGVPLPGKLLPIAILFLIVGALSLIAGARVKIGAALLAVFLVLATFYFHNFWAVEDAAKQMQMIQFMKNLSILGGLFCIAASGPGLLSVDGILGRAGAPDVTSFDVVKAAGRQE